MSSPSKKTLRPKAVILTDPEEMRKARLDQPLLTSEEKKQQRLRMLEADRFMRDSLENCSSSEDGQRRQAVS